MNGQMMQMSAGGVLQNMENDSMDDDDEERARKLANFKPKITQEQIDQMHHLQGIDLFDDIADIKNAIKFDNI